MCVGARVNHVVIDLERLEELVPVPRPVETVLSEEPLKLIEDPLFDELLERLCPSLDRRQIVHGESGYDREKEPVPPEPLVDEVLRIRRIVLNDGAQDRPSDLRMPRLVGLDALNHLLEHPVSDEMGHGRQAHELEVREAGFEDEV